jgi:hypothetical protein
MHVFLLDAIPSCVMQLASHRCEGAFTVSDWETRQLLERMSSRKMPFGALSEVPASAVEARGDTGIISR